MIIYEDWGLVIRDRCVNYQYQYRHHYLVIDPHDPYCYLPILMDLCIIIIKNIFIIIIYFLTSSPSSRYQGPVC